MKKRVLASLLAFTLAVSGLSVGNGKVQAEDVPVASTALQEEQTRETISFNTDWRYKKGDVQDADKKEFEDRKWGYVNLPHSTTFYTAENKDAYLGISWYRKHFSIDENLREKKLFLTFEGIMQKADVYINGALVWTHEGGYIPFVIDISEKVRYGAENVIAVKADSRANQSFAPGKDVPDFQYFGGIYGNSYLTVTDGLHITDAVEADVTAGGGVFITAPGVSREEATLKVKTHVENETSGKEEVTLLTELLDADGTVAAQKEDRMELGAGRAETFEQSMTVSNPRLWSPNTPNLYTVRSTVRAGGAVKDVQETSYGIRKVEWKRDSIYINDEKMDVSGANLHEETYMFGNAAPDNAIYEEVKRFKENGFDFMRMSHYPHRQAYYDACDKYGVMVLECASGWQYFNNTDAFKESTYRELRTDIRHKRNHPCIVAWETSLNESHYTSAWASEMNRIAKEEYPADGQSYAYTAGCISWEAWDIGLSTPQAGIFRNSGYGAENPAYANKPMIIAEYGDWNYGGSSSTTRVTREAENNFRVRGGDEGMLVQADNIQESVQTNRSRGAQWLAASMYWDYADYAGFDSGILTCCGVVDLYRIPKYGAYFFRSQRSADTDLTEYGLESGPMVFIANAWDDKADTEVRIFSNCDTVELFLNGKSLGEKGHDTTIWGPHGDVDPMNYPNGKGKEISADSLQNAPITFELDQYEAGELRAVGKINGKEAAEYIRRTPGQASTVALRPESDAAVPLDGSSAKLVWIDITDEAGTVVTDAYMDVDLETEGPGLVVGPKTITTKGGQLAVWVKSKRGSGDIRLRASADGLRTAEIVIPTEPVSGLDEAPEGGDADEYAESGKEAVNIFRGKASRASTENISGSTVEQKENANDGDENTKWCASSGSYPQWWEADLGDEHTLESMSLSFETPGANYYYTVAVSDEPMTDANYTEHIVADRSMGSADTDLFFDEPVKGRYVRISFTQASNGEWAVLREVSGTGDAKNVAMNKPVSASSVNTGGNGQEKAEYAVDGNADTLWCARGGAGTTGHWIQVDLKGTYHLSDVNVLFEKADAEYKFVLQGSIDGKHYRDIQDFRQGAGFGQLAEISLDEIVQYLRIYDISTKNPASQWPAIREIAAYGEKTEYHLTNTAREKAAFASSSKAGSKPEDGNNGVPGWYWYPEGQGEAWWYVDMNGLYDLDNVQMTWNALEEHRYRIDISVDGKTWETVVDRSAEGNSEIQPYEMVEGTARYVRVTLPAGHAEGQGFGLFSVYGTETEPREIKTIIQPEGIQAAAGTAFENLKLPGEVMVQLQDGTSMTLPVTWNRKDYNSAKAGTIVLTGEVAQIPGIAFGAAQKAQITVTLYEKNSGTEEPHDPPRVQVPAEGSVWKDGKLVYRVTKASAAGGTVAVVKAAKKNPVSVKIPATVKLNGYVFKVTSVSAKAFQKNAKLKTLVIGKNVTTIGQKSFFQCKKLKKITFQVMKAPKAGKQAFKGISAKCRILVPKKMAKKQVSNLKKRMKKAGVGKGSIYGKK